MSGRITDRNSDGIVGRSVGDDHDIISIRVRSDVISTIPDGFKRSVDFVILGIIQLHSNVVLARNLFR